MKMAKEDESEFSSESEGAPASESEGEPTSESEGGNSSESEGGTSSVSEGGPASESEGGTSGSGSEGAGRRQCASPTPALTDYEASRLANLERNKRRLEELGLQDFTKKKLEEPSDVIVQARRTPIKRSVRFEDEPREEEVTRITRSRSAASPTSRTSPKERKVCFSIQL